MEDIEIEKIAKDAADMSAKTLALFNQADGDHRLRQPDLFERSFGFYKWTSKNGLTDRQIKLYMKVYRENYVPTTE